MSVPDRGCERKARFYIYTEFLHNEFLYMDAGVKMGNGVLSRGQEDQKRHIASLMCQQRNPFNILALVISMIIR